MADEYISSRGLSVLRGGSGEPLVVLLHGLGANRAVWQRMIEIAGKHQRLFRLESLLRILMKSRHPS